MAEKILLRVLFWALCVLLFAFAAVIPVTPYILVLAADFNPYAMLVLLVAGVMVMAATGAILCRVRGKQRLAWGFLTSGYAAVALAVLGSITLAALYSAYSMAVTAL